jgi:transcriptional regulator with XRE-family HTH domain
MFGERETAQSFGDALREFRLRARMTQRELADALSLDFTYVSKIEGRRVPPPARDRIERAAEALNLSSDERARLFELAEKLPSELEGLAVRPDAQRLYRGILEIPEAEQDRLFDDLIDLVEKRNRSTSRGDG